MPDQVEPDIRRAFLLKDGTTINTQGALDGLPNYEMVFVLNSAPQVGHDPLAHANKILEEIGEELRARGIKFVNDPVREGPCQLYLTHLETPRIADELQDRLALERLAQDIQRTVNERRHR